MLLRRGGKCSCSLSAEDRFLLFLCLAYYFKDFRIDP